MARAGRIFLTVSLAALALLAVGALGAGTAAAGTPIDEFASQPSTTQAGGHPDVLYRLNTKNHNESKANTPCNCEDVRDQLVSLPGGVTADPHATPRCSLLDFSKTQCPPDSQVGVIYITALLGSVNGVQAIYNMQPRTDEAGLLAFYIPGYMIPQYEVVEPRTGGDYGLDVLASSNVHAIPPEDLTQVMWGVPADPIHDKLRMPLGTVGYGGVLSNVAFCDEKDNPSTYDPSTVRQICGDKATPLPSSAPEKPLLSNPTTCGVPLESRVQVTAYDNESTFASAPWPATTGCDQLSFNPSLAARPTTDQTDTASGLDVDLVVPQFVSPTVPSPSQIKETTVTLPQGFSINPNAADGKVACADEQANFGTRNAAECPEHAKVGTLSIESAALPGPLPGAIYLGTPLPGERYRLILTADGFGVHVKLPGSVYADAQTGQVVASFKNLPQAPFQRFEMHFFGSERGLLATPTKCGTYPVQTTFVPWNSALPDQGSTQFFDLTAGPGGKPCPGPAESFEPSVSAGAANHTGGMHSPFSLKLTREDGEQILRSIDVSTPPGFAATLRGIPYCSDAALASAAARTAADELAAPSCPAASRVGSSQAGAGAGTHPLHVQGSVYLAGPHAGAPLSLAVVTPALSGPYDLGNVVVRVAIHVNPDTAQITAVSDPLPTILEGIPLRLRSVLVNLDRPGFTLNPTNCDPFAVASAVFSDQGARFDVRNRFQATNCADLDFTPKLALKLSGGTRRTGHPALTAVLRQPGGESNIRFTSVALPRSLQLENAHIKDICTRPLFAADNCPASSIYGSATAVSPLLDEPLSGPVVLKPSNNKLPDLVASLRGQIDIDLTGRIDSVNGGMRVTFGAIPDAGVSRFTLNMKGGGKSLLVNTTDLCRKGGRAVAKIRGQNGLSADQKPKIQAVCGKARKAKKKADRKGVR